jgi:hypothetical protein
MPSCSTSSNISSSINALSVVQGGSRLIVSIPASSATGITIGNVIRYDQTATGFTASKANDPANSEVFGVVESYNSSNSSYQVVIYGSVNLLSSSLADMGYSGACGGNDIYFLSGTTAGLLQNLAPSNIDHVIKPVYQAAPHGSYSGVVINYLGYRIGGDVQAAMEDTELGNIQIVVGDNTFTNGYVDASISHELPIVDYFEFYSKFEKQYGYVEALTLTTTPAGNISFGAAVTQAGNPNYAGTVTFVDFGNKILYVYKNPTTADINPSVNISVFPVGSSTPATYTLANTSIYAVQSPRVILTQPINILGRLGASPVPQITKVGIKVKPQGVKVSIPNVANFTGITANTISLGKTASSRIDLETKLNNFEERITILESRI